MTGQKKADTLEVGTLLLQDNYRIEALLGTGGASKVYRATHVPLDETVAIKILHSQKANEEYFIEMMKNELHRIEHPAVVRYTTLQHTKEHGGIFFLVMEYVPGPSLEKQMKRGPVASDDLLEIAAHLLAGLEECHAQGIFHLDISPDNIILRDGKADQATLIDFGIAREVGADARTQFGLGLACKFEYAAPEQMNGQSGARSDLYALGATLLAAARGKAPVVPGDAVEVEIAKRQPLDTTRIAQPLKGLIDALTAPDPIDRPDAPGQALALISQAVPPSGSAGAPWQQTARPIDKTRYARDDEPTEIDIMDGLGKGKDGSEHSEARRRPPGKPRRGKRRWPWLALPLLAAPALFFHPDIHAALFGERLELVEPYRLSATRLAEGAGSIGGSAPSAEAVATIARVAEEHLGPDVQVDLTPARGAPNDKWIPMVLSLVQALRMLDEGTFTLEDGNVSLKGVAPTSDSLEQARNTVIATGTGNGYTWDLDLELAPQFLDFRTAADLLKSHSDCGSLSFGDRDGNFAPGEPLSPTGMISGVEVLDALRPSLEAIADGREIRLEGIEMLNPVVCRMLALLPPQEYTPLSLRYRSYTSDDVLEEDFFDGDDYAVVDLIAPASLDGYLYVFLIDEDAQAFHLRPGPPRSGREDNRLAKTPPTSTGEREVAVLFPLEDARTSIFRSPQIGLSDAVGEVMMLTALVAAAPLFDETRFDAPEGQPGATETIDSLVKDLESALADAGTVVVVHRLIRVR